MTPRQLTAAINLEAACVSEDLLNDFSVSRQAAHASATEAKKFVKELGGGI